MTDLRLAELTPDNLPAAVRLTLRPGQEKFVAPVVQSIAEAYVTPTAWPRVVLDGDQVVGFVLANFDPDNELAAFRCGIWRLNVAADAQGRGVGRFAVGAVAAEARRRGRSAITVLWEKGSEGPEGFYLRLGFRPTGELFGEVVGELDVAAVAPADPPPAKSFRRTDLRGAEFFAVDLREARIVEADVSGLVLRGVDAAGLDIDAPWAGEGGGVFLNGVDVVPFVEAELDRRFPGRADRRATDPDGLRAAWSALERTWAATLDRAAALPAGAVDVSVAGEWSFAQTLRHLVLATDLWLGRAILRLDRPHHPLGLADAGAERHGLDMSVFTTDPPTYAEVLAARAGRVAMVRDFIATATPDLLAEPRVNPWAPQRPETVLSCLHTILEEEWEHHRFAVRDLDALPSDG